MLVQLILAQTLNRIMSWVLTYGMSHNKQGENSLLKILKSLNINYLVICQKNK